MTMHPALLLSALNLLRKLLCLSMDALYVTLNIFLCKDRLTLILKGRMLGRPSNHSTLNRWTLFWDAFPRGKWHKEQWRLHLMLLAAKRSWKDPGLIVCSGAKTLLVNTCSCLFGPFQRAVFPVAYRQSEGTYQHRRKNPRVCVFNNTAMSYTMKFRDALGIFSAILPFQSVHLLCLGVGAYPSRRRPRSLAHSPWATRYDVTFPLARSDGTGFWIGEKGLWVPLVQVYYSWVLSLLGIDYFHELS